jgi:hypothetical protein
VLFRFAIVRSIDLTQLNHLSCAIGKNATIVVQRQEKININQTRNVECDVRASPHKFCVLWRRSRRQIDLHISVHVGEVLVNRSNSLPILIDRSLFQKPIEECKRAVQMSCTFLEKDCVLLLDKHVHGTVTFFARNHDANVVMFDVTNRASFVAAQSLLSELQRVTRGATLVLVANKCDSDARVVSSDEAKSVAGAHDAMFFEASALLDSSCVKKCVESIAQDLLSDGGALTQVDGENVLVSLHASCAQAAAFQMRHSIVPRYDEQHFSCLFLNWLVPFHLSKVDLSTIRRLANCWTVRTLESTAVIAALRIRQLHYEQDR